MSSSPTAARRGEYTPAPLSPFQLSQPYMDKLTTQKQTSSSGSIEKPSAKTDLNFIEKVTKSSSGNLYWDSGATASASAKAKAKEAMAMSSLSSTVKKKRKVVEAFQEARRRRNVKDEFSHFCTETSFTALVRIYNASSWARRIGWILVFLVMFGWLTYQVSA